MTDLVQLGFSANTAGLTRAQTELDKTTVAGGRLDKQSKLTERSLGLVGAAIAAVGVTASVREVIQYTDSWSNLNTQLRQVTSSEEQLLGVREQLLQVSRETRINLSSTVDLYAEMSRGTSELNLSSDKLVEITKTLNNLFLAGGKPLSEMTGAIRQLNQGFASGVLRGDEFNSVAEGAPRIMDALSASLGKTRGELREFAATGGITSAVMVKALESYSGTAQQLANTVKQTFEQNMELVSTNVTQFVGESEVLNSSVDVLGGSLVSLSENIEATGYAVGAAAGVISLAAIPAMTKYTASLLSTASAQLLAGTTAVKTSNALGVVTVQAARATIATNALGIATKLLLGPVGLVIAAVGAAYFAFDQVTESMDEATESADKHADKISRLEKLYSAMSQAQLGTTYVESQQRAIELDEQRLALTEKLSQAQAKESESNKRNGDSRSKATNIYTAQVKALESSLGELDVEISKNNESLETMASVFDDGVDGIATTSEAIDKITTSSSSLAAENIKLSNSYAGQLLALQDQQLQLSMTADEFELYNAMQTASAYGATPEMTKQIREQVIALQSQRSAIKAASTELEGLMSDDLFGFGDGIEEQEKSLSSLTDEIDNFGGAWSRTGNVVVDAFGNMSDAMNDYGSRMESIGKIQDKLNSEFKAAGDDKEQLAKLDKLQIKLNQEMVSAELSGYQALASGAASMFSEKTAAAKAFGAISQVLAVAEIALSYQKMTASTTETGVVLANEATKQSANALTAITAAFAAPFPVGFVAGAAMIGIMAALVGGSFSGGGGSYEMPEEGGTGTVLGDSSAQSASITNALEGFDDIQIDQLAELRGIRSSMQELNNGITQLAKSFVSGLDFGDSGYTGELGLIDSFSLPSLIDKLPNFIDPLLSIADELLGGIIGSFSSTKKELVDSGIRFVSQTYAEIFDSGQVDASVFQVIEKTKKKFWGLSKSKSTNTELTGIDSEIAEQIANVFGYIGDTVIAASDSLFGNEFTEQLLSSFKIDIGDISFKDKTGDEIQSELEAIFSQQADLMTNYVFPQLQEYQEMGEGLFETLIRVNQEQALFNDAIERTGNEYSKFMSELEKIDVAQAVIGMVGGAEQFSDLINDFFGSFYSESEQLEYLKGSITDVFDQLGLSVSDSKSAFKDLVQGVDLTTEEGQKLYATLLQLSPSMGEYLDALDDLANDKLSLQIELLSAQGKSEEALALSRQMELDAMDESLHGLQKAIWAQEDLNAARDKEIDALNELRSTLESNVAFAEQQLELARKAEVDRLNLVIDGAQDAYNSTLDSINAQRNAYDSLINDLTNSVSTAASELEKSRNLELSKINLTIAASQLAYDKTLESINAQRSAYNSLVAELTDSVSSASAELGKSRDLEISRINLTLDASQMAYDKTLESISAQREAYNGLISDLESGVQNSESALNASLSAELSRYDELIAQSESSATAQINAINSMASARISALNEERSVVASISASLGAASKAITATEALSMARRGDFSGVSNISTGESFASAESASIAAARESFALSEIGKLADSQLSSIDRTIAASEQGAAIQVNAINKASEREVASLEAQRLEIENQVNAILGIDNTVLSIADAIAEYQLSQEALQSEIDKDTLEQLQSQEDAALQSYEQAQTNAQEQISALIAQVDAILGVDSSVKELDEAISAYQAAKLALDEEMNSGLLDRLQSQEDAALASYEQAQVDAQAQIDALNSQVDAILGIDSSTKELSEAIADYQAAQLELDKELNNGLLEKLQTQEDAALAYYEQVKSDAEAQIDALNMQVDELLNLNESVMGVAEAIALLNQERQELAAFDYDAQLEQINAQYATIDLLTEINEAVHDISAPPSEIPNYTDPSLVNEIKMLRQDLDNANSQIGENTKRTADSVRTLTYMQEIQ